jgi:hypothetical protein
MGFRTRFPEEDGLLGSAPVQQDVTELWVKIFKDRDGRSADPGSLLLPSRVLNDRLEVVTEAVCV